MGSGPHDAVRSASVFTHLDPDSCVACRGLRGAGHRLASCAREVTLSTGLAVGSFVCAACARAGDVDVAAAVTTVCEPRASAVEEPGPIVTPLVEDAPLVRPLEAEAAPVDASPPPARRAVRGSQTVASAPQPAPDAGVTGPDVPEAASEQGTGRDPVAESYLPRPSSALQPRTTGW